MQILPTQTPNAKMHGEDIVVRIQDDIEIRMTLHEALAFTIEVQRCAGAALEASRHIQPDPCQIIAFPSLKGRSAIVAPRHAGRA